MSGASGRPGQRKVWYLRHINLFASMTDMEIEELAQLLDDHYLPAGAELLHDRQRDRIYLIKSGVVRLYAAEEGHDVTLALLSPGRLFGLSTTVGDENPRLGATTLEPSYICSTTWARLIEVLVHHPPVLLEMMRTLAEQVFLTETWVVRLRATQPAARLAHLLLELSNDFGEPAEPGRRIRFRLTEADLARMIGLSRETVSRLLAAFLQAGWVAREQGRLVVVDRLALADQARSRPQP